jgi:hypothetical protein
MLTATGSELRSELLRRGLLWPQGTPRPDVWPGVQSASPITSRPLPLRLDEPGRAAAARTIARGPTDRLAPPPLNQNPWLPSR